MKEEERNRLITAFRVMRKAAENSVGTLAYHQDLQAQIDVLAQLVNREIRKSMEVENGLHENDMDG